MSVPRLTKPNLLPPPSPLKKIAFEEHFLVPEALKKNPDGDDVLQGDFHGHPYGELNLVVPLDEGAQLMGLQGWQGAGWTAPDPGSAHYPEVKGGRLIALFYLPAGRISYDVEAPTPKRAG